MTENTTSVETGRAATHAYETIRERILTGDLPEGHWLRETDLAGDIGVSRTPVREALRRLAAEGLVLYQQNRGVQVQSWRTEDLEEIFALRTLLEPWGCSLAATSGLADIEQLGTLADAMDTVAAKRRPDLVELTDLNNRFHGAILEASGNSRLRSLVASVVRVPLVSRTFSLYSRDALARSLSHHQELVQALDDRDPDWAESVMRSHIRAAWSSLRPQVAAGGRA
ncbi:GntR family transcriptional regulator [Solicola gregarius]|uniref:GntR family transcriptional regulator n=1 Tax=Solicola gregarius TaxID=2908642 RepID=A0AA46TG01_9ACTN|nr:GntR family transcriptional regulator [Solicola gregarius]UYM04659.1 GntR family transcriptional regulator [Solicola gregarius]